jgi:hypothetical protein
MSSTTNIQNLLVNVFRPVYSYDPTTTTFTPKLELSNIDTVSGNSVSVFTAAVGDANSNVYVGSNAGNPYTALQSCRFVTALGYSAANAIFNVSNSVFVGYNAGAGASGASSNVIVGANATGNGTSNVRIGSSSTGTGSFNVSVGATCATSTYSNCILLGPGLVATQDAQLQIGTSYLTGNLATKWLGFNTPTSLYPDSNSRVDISGNTTIKGQVGINMIPVRTVDVNGDFRVADASGTTMDYTSGSLTLSDGFTRTLNGTPIPQPVLQYGKATTGSGGSGTVSVTLPTTYASSSSYVVQVTMADTDPAEMSANITASNAFDIYWANGSGGTHTIFWTTYGL